MLNRRAQHPVRTISQRAQMRFVPPSRLNSGSTCVCSIPTLEHITSEYLLAAFVCIGRVRQRKGQPRVIGAAPSFAGRGNTAGNKFVLPREQRIEAGFEWNGTMHRRATSLLNDVLPKQDNVVEDRCIVTDMIVGWTVNWGCRQGLLEEVSRLQAYPDRLFECPNCLFPQDSDPKF